MLPASTDLHREFTGAAGRRTPPPNSIRPPDFALTVRRRCSVSFDLTCKCDGNEYVNISGGSGTVRIIPLTGLPLFKPGDDIAVAITAALQRQGLTLENGDVVVAARKVISKVEDRAIRIGTVAI